MDTQLLLGIVFLSILTLILLLAAALQKKKDPMLQRIQNFTPDSQKNKTDLNESAPVEVGAQLKSSVNRILVQLGEQTNRKEKKRSNLRQLLIHAGIRSDEKVNRYFGFKLFAAVACFAISLGFGLLGEQSLAIVIMLSVVMGAVGNQIPELILKQRIRRRQSSIAEGLPDALDLLVICVEAGLGLNAAILRVGQDISDRCEPLSEELLRVNQDLRGGISREESLRSLSERNLVEDLKILVGALILSDRLGTSIADTLRSQADSLRTRIRQKAEEQAAKAGIKMLLPLVLFILPALIIILMGPGVIAVFKTFK
ncbi:type II secretion system F family protein [candidate division KSB1 bacterium]|nr:type II secretion system F family protein [candidate division KSB1 bacterium]